MGWVANTILGFAVVLQIAVVSLCALWPIRRDLSLLSTVQGWHKLYSIADSNLDVWLLSSLACLGNIICLTSIANLGLRRRAAHVAPRYRVAQILIAVLALMCEVCHILVKDAMYGFVMIS